MGKRRRRDRGEGPPGLTALPVPPATPRLPASATRGGSPRRLFIGVIGGAALVAAAISLTLWLYPKVKAEPTIAAGHDKPGDAPPAFVKSAACAECHPKQHQQWIGSHHDLAMQPA